VELGRRGEEIALWLERSEGERRIDRIRIDPPPRVRFSSVHVLGQKLAWIEPRAGKPHLFVRDLGLDKGPPGPIEDAGALGTDAVRISACRTASGLAFALRGGGATWVTLREMRGGSPLVRVEEPPRPKGAESVESFACEEGAISTVVVAKKNDTYGVVRMRCTRDACDVSRLALEDLWRGRDPAARPAPLEGEESSVLVVPLGERLLVVWRTADAGVRARIGDAASIASAPDIIVYDEASQDVNGAGRIHAMRLFAQQDAALLLLHAVSGIKAILIGKDGRTMAIRADL
jgi:hypothetical protein